MDIQAQTLARLPVGTSATVIGLRGDSSFTQRLREMGVLPRTKLTVIRMAPLGDPIEIEVRGYKLSLRKIEAECIEVETTP